MESSSVSFLSRTDSRQGCRAALLAEARQSFLRKLLRGDPPVHKQTQLFVFTDSGISILKSESWFSSMKLRFLNALIPIYRNGERTDSGISVQNHCLFFLDHLDPLGMVDFLFGICLLVFLLSNTNKYIVEWLNHCLIFLDHLDPLGIVDSLFGICLSVFFFIQH